MLNCHFFGHNFKIPHMHDSQNLKHWFKEHAAEHFGGDIQKFSSKLPGFVWSRYPGGKHIPSYISSPGTRLDIRLNENNIPKQGEEPINAFDQLAHT